MCVFGQGFNVRKGCFSTFKLVPFKCGGKSRVTDRLAVLKAAQIYRG